MEPVGADGGKKRCIDDIIEHMTADFGGYEGQYIQFLGSSSATGPVWSPPSGSSGSVYYPQQGELGMMDVGGGNFVVYQTKPNPEFTGQPVGFIHYPTPQSQAQQNLVQPHIDYSQRPFNENVSNGCLIENVVGNWAPNRNGTYSPFGGLVQDEAAPQGAGDQSRAPAPPGQQAPVKKQRIVAEVKPMRPSYSDVLAKSPPLTPPPTTKAASKPTNQEPVKPIKPEAKKPQGKTPTGSGGKSSSNLKRQNSSGSEETLVEKVKLPARRWSSTEDLAPSPPKTSEQKKEKKKKINKSSKTADRDDKADNIYKEPEIKTPHRKDSSPSVVGPSLAKANADRPTGKPKLREERKGSATKAERATNSSRKLASKRTQRTYRKRDSNLGALMRKWKEQVSIYFMYMASWLINLLWDVTAMSTSLLLLLFSEGCEKTMLWLGSAKSGISGITNRWKWWGKKERKFPKKPPVESHPLPGSLSHNITLPTTGEEAMKRLLSCKGKDPYSILGVTSACTDEEIKKYYKSQALLVHPDKNSQPGAEEAFKILVHAFDLIAEPEKRAAYDRYVAETNQVEQAWSELSDLLSQLHEKMEYAANTIRCNNCGKRHKRQMTDRPSYAARFCAQCKIHHSAKEGDMWAESRGWGWWGVRYYACMEGAVYDITQWANCQGNSIQKVKPDSHSVQYRVLMGRAPQHNPPPEPDIEDLLNSLYSQNGTGRNKKKSKKNK
ncbi:hypothetical protein GE061_007843 [Apolygus lucorum]|uniref:J domain-containing protein n=1 Tax=Apolygus lucorum TaxID=248454 RepID=A0A8S9WQL6_APOLU|nr:hypothetical protein GE061_007843 [Apolygus lucorum]